MQIFTVSFFGHRQISNALEVGNRLEQIIQKLLREKGYVEFLVGRDGEFDQLVSSTVRRCKRTIRDDNSSLVWVMPYVTAEFRDNEGAFREYYDEIEVCTDAAGGYFKAVYQIRNRAMADRSDMVILCVEHESGGAWQVMKYVKRRKVPYINIARGDSE